MPTLVVFLCGAWSALGIRRGNPMNNRGELNPFFFNPSSTWEITELPEIFEADFVYNKKWKGRWLYNYPEKKTVVEWWMVVDEVKQLTKKISYYFNYQWVGKRFKNQKVQVPKMMKMMTSYGTPGIPDNYAGQRLSGELGDPRSTAYVVTKCTKLDLRWPYDRLFSPRSWKKLENTTILRDTFSMWIEDQGKATISWAGYSPMQDRRRITGKGLSDQTLTFLSIDKNTWDFTKFIPWSNLGYNWGEVRALPMMRDIEPPLAMCHYGGALVQEKAWEIQTQVPFLLVKPGTKNITEDIK